MAGLGQVAFAVIPAAAAVRIPAVDESSGPSLTLNVVAGALAGLVIGIVGAFVRRRLAERGALAPAPRARRARNGAPATYRS